MVSGVYLPQGCIEYGKRKSGREVKSFQREITQHLYFFYFLNFFFFFFAWVLGCFACVYVHPPRLCSGQEGALDPLELE